MQKLFSLNVFFLLIFLVGCSDKAEENHIKQVNIDEVGEMIDGEKDGFFVPTISIDREYITILKEVFEDYKDENLYIYYTMQPEGESGEILKRDQYKYVRKMPKESIYYVKGGEIYKGINLRTYESSDLSSAIEQFIEENR